MPLNIKGKYSQGIVDPGKEAQQLRSEIAEKLTGLQDTQRNITAIKNVYIAQKVYKGPYKNQAPDLIVGYNVGYRASWQMAIGNITDELFHENNKAWSGDHCIDHTLVPGVLFCNRPIDVKDPAIVDIAPTILEMFGIKTPKYMDGKAINIPSTNGDAEKTENTKPVEKA